MKEPKVFFGWYNWSFKHPQGTSPIKCGRTWCQNITHKQLKEIALKEAFTGADHPKFQKGFKFRYSKVEQV